VSHALPTGYITYVVSRRSFTAVVSVDRGAFVEEKYFQNERLEIGDHVDAKNGAGDHSRDRTGKMY